MISFTLLPFEDGGEDSLSSISGTLVRDSERNLLRLSYILTHAGELVSLDDTLIPARRDELWRATCLECFIKCPSHKDYWEMNISLNGSWNVYQFSDYRKDMARADLSEVTLQTQKESAELATSTVTWSLPPEIGRVDRLDVNISAILKQKAGNLQYMALAHPPDRPDFHWPESFLLSI